MTSYVVLELHEPADETMGEGPHWVQGPTVEAVSAEAAIRKCAADHGSTSFVAVPLRSFQVMTVTVETKRTVKVG